MKKELLNDKVFAGPLGHKALRKPAKKISQKQIDKLLSRRNNTFRITFEMGNTPDEILFYSYNPEKSGDENFLGKRRVA